ncbi:MAG: hypothetical protein ACI97N_000534 [Cognaticolwellia sp.]|jgi:hypothetical protein
MFSSYLELGFDHIADLDGYDHILFIIALCAIYRLSEWKKVLILVTAFTIGHSITLALAALKMVMVSAELVEFLIPLTIFITALYNVLQKVKENSKVPVYYITALLFGLIHGLGFSNYFRSLLGRELDITMPLFAFNVGLEAGQLIIVMIILAANYLFLNVLSVKQREWNLFISGAAAGVALVMMFERVFW